MPRGHRYQEVLAPESIPLPLRAEDEESPDAGAAPEKPRLEIPPEQ